MEITGCPPALSSHQGHIWAPASHPPRGTQSGKETEGSREQNRSGKAIKKQVSGLEAGKWGTGWGTQEGGKRGIGEKGPALINSSTAACRLGVRGEQGDASNNVLTEARKEAGEGVLGEGGVHLRTLQQPQELGTSHQQSWLGTG